MRLFALYGLLLALAGCSLIPDRTLVYQQAEPAPRMQVPEGMPAFPAEDLFPIPDVEKRVSYTGERFEVPEPPRLAVLGRDTGDLADDDAALMDPTNIRVVLARDGNGYPIIMLATQFAWAWEHVGQALLATDLRIDDRNRESGIYYIRVPSRYGLEERDAQLKLSHTVNGIQVAVLNRRGTSLVGRDAGQAILQRLYEQL